MEQKQELEFQPWPKIGRVSPFSVVISEKLDGTNGCIVIRDGKLLAVQSRKRFIVEGDDNYGFAKWVNENLEDILKLGDGHHYGEWAGEGIQKNPHSMVGKKFFLFNTARWNPDNPNRPDCCDVVPVLYEGTLEPETIPNVMDQLLKDSPAPMRPEGVVCFYKSFKMYTKHTFNSPNGKWCKD